MLLGKYVLESKGRLSLRALKQKLSLLSLALLLVYSIYWLSFIEVLNTAEGCLEIAQRDPEASEPFKEYGPSL